MALSVVDVDDVDEVGTLLSSKENCEKFELKIYPPIVVRLKGKPVCAHRVGTSFPEQAKYASWIHSEFDTHSDLTPEGCIRVVALLAAKNAKSIVNGKSLAAIEAKAEGKSLPEDDDEDKDEELKKLLEASL